MKDKNDVIQEFNQYVNMSAAELEKWLKSGDSKDAGWSKEDGSGESVGHDSGRKIIAILKANPKKEPGKYTDDQVEHMRRVVAYCKRHIAQEKGPNSEKSAAEVKKTKSYASLKNWGHDPLKKLDSKDGAKSGKAGKEEKEEPAEEAEDDEGESEDEHKDSRAGQKRKAPSKSKSSSQKEPTPGTRKSQRLSSQPKTSDSQSKTSGGQSKTGTKKSQATNGTSKKSKKDDDDKDNQSKNKPNEIKKTDGKKAAKGPKPGDTVSWNWGSGAPKGKVLDVKGGKTTITTKRGNEVSREGDPQDPAVVIDSGKSKAIKFNHELN